MIAITNLRKSFPTEAGPLAVLNGVDMTIEKGKIISIMGASGAGKSTLLHVTGTLDRPTEGEVSYTGKNVFELDDKALAAFRNKTIGFVFQFHNLLPEFTALENTIMPGLIAGLNTDELRERGRTILGELGLKDRLLHRPGELSGGEQQRVAVARALILDPLVVLADEPTGNLDTKTGEMLIDLLLDINHRKGTTFVIVTHNEAFAKKTDITYVMADGTLKT
ncbi:ABC transporter ATP-binding protein [Candidatus Magnetominusculus xianensis]|uniref:ABC transporter ATP-binding protein n=1 Tax=Candidatus Magnetominusculus xianensis TaxID=1748249 RepID=A0ABR5SEA4_9BACT|nr:ABC transporter ATP-binding protein [Candidatus Magnetominusculus xianensis]KWT79607.1 ABC transporter ATP-binding protein [Candidatus Magnetominusculus xianensis]MBF0403820.1 ABC transporter ATP-binding protein [Nitrospirota bacterium]